MVSSHESGKTASILVDCKSSWIPIGRWNDSIQHGETIDYNGGDECDGE